MVPIFQKYFSSPKKLEVLRLEVSLYQFYQTYKQSLCDDLDNDSITSQAQTKT